jgi:two-component system sensor histidine kinase AgrC
MNGSDYNELKELRKLVKTQTGYLEKSEAYLKELRRYRHDQKNNLIAVSGLLESGDIEGAKKYVGSFVEILNRKTAIINTGNPSIDMVITSKIAKAQEFNIKVQHIIGLPQDVQINRKDLCLAVGSCFDNAIEACIKARQKHRHPVISLQLIEKHGVIIFKMTNTSVTPVPENFSGISTTKEDTKNHGFGLKNVREIVATHNGYLEVIPEERQFTINFTLQGD